LMVAGFVLEDMTKKGLLNCEMSENDEDSYSLTEKGKEAYTFNTQSGLQERDE